MFYNNSVVGEIDFVLEKANETVWHIRTESRATSLLAKAFGSEVTQASHFYWDMTTEIPTLVPLTYHHVSREPLRTRFWQHHFDWDSQTSKTITHQGDQVISLPEQLLDPLTLRLQLAVDLNMSDPKIEERNFWVLDRDDVEAQRIEYRDAEPVQVSAGCFEAHHYYRFRKEGSARNYDLWVSPDLDWLPLRTLQTDGKREIRIDLKSSTLLKQPRNCNDAGRDQY